MFDSESKMSKPVIRWMQNFGLQVKAEFITPWGVCDLVGISFRARNVNHRRKLGQNQPITSVTRAALLTEIPDEATGDSVSLRALARKYAYVMPPEVVDSQVRRLIAEKFVVQMPSGEFQKRNGWVPLQKRFVAVELKLHRIEEVMSQANNNLLFAQESYVALPRDIADRVYDKRSRWSDFFACGVGLLSVTPRRCEIIIRSQPDASSADNLLQFCSVEKFWRTFPKGK